LLNRFLATKRLLKETDAKVWLRWEGLPLLDLLRRLSAERILIKYVIFTRRH